MCGVPVPFISKVDRNNRDFLAWHSRPPKSLAVAVKNSRDGGTGHGLLSLSRQRRAKSASISTKLQKIQHA